MPKAPLNTREFAALLQVVEHLRGPEGCPWDKEQTHQTLTRYMLEEAHEFCEVVDTGQPREMLDELGDVLLQVVLHSEIARQAGTFDIADVIENLNHKMIRRHPHVFGDVKVSTSTEVLDNWAQIKAQEKPNKPQSWFSIPRALPALLRSFKIGEKTKKYSFDWENAEQCWPKVDEELGELKQAIASADLAEIEAELGDVLFSVAQLARHLNMDPEQALRKTNQRFETRFQRMRNLVEAAGLDWTQVSSKQKEEFWKQAKA